MNLDASDDDVDGVDVTRLAGANLTGPDLAAYEEAAFRTYQDAFHRNAADPNLHNAAALVEAWNNFALVMGLEPIAQMGAGHGR